MESKNAADQASDEVQKTVSKVEEEKLTEKPYDAKKIIIGLHDIVQRAWQGREVAQD